MVLHLHGLYNDNPISDCMTAASSALPGIGSGQCALPGLAEPVYNRLCALYHRPRLLQVFIKGSDGKFGPGVSERAAGGSNFATLSGRGLDLGVRVRGGEGRGGGISARWMGACTEHVMLNQHQECCLVSS
jgi:hypothetical protein